MKVDIEKIKEILAGIDTEERNDDYGWWETSNGAEFGYSKLQELIDYINEVQADV